MSVLGITYALNSIVYRFCQYRAKKDTDTSIHEVSGVTRKDLTVNGQLATGKII